MLSSKDIADSIKIKLNANFGTDNISVDTPRIVITYNEKQIVHLANILNSKKDELLLEAQRFLVTEELVNGTKKQDREQYTLPNDFFKISSAYVTAKKGECESKVYLFPIKDNNYGEIIPNDNTKASFDYKEAPYFLNDKKLSILKDDDFSIEKCFITYYRYPNQIDIEGYINSNNNWSSNIDSEWDEKNTLDIIHLVVEEFQRNDKDQVAFQLSKDRIVNKN